MLNLPPSAFKILQDMLNIAILFMHIQMDIGCCYSINIGCLLQNCNKHSFVHSLNIELEPPLNIHPILP
jgi:hypothetical protein